MISALVHGVLATRHAAAVPTPEVLLLHFGNGNGSVTFTDSSPYDLTLTGYGGIDQSTVHTFFGTSSLECGPGKSLQCDQLPPMLYDSCWEGRGYMNSYGPGGLTDWGCGFLDLRVHAFDLTQPFFGFSNTGKLRMWVGFGMVAEGTNIIPLTTDYHWAITYEQSTKTWRGFIDGVKEFEVVVAVGDQYSRTAAIGANYDWLITYDGYLGEIRYSLGTRVYNDAGFTPPAAPFTTVPDPLRRPWAVHLHHFDGGNGSAVFTDEVQIAPGVTVQGGALQSTSQVPLGISSVEMNGVGQGLNTQQQVSSPWIYTTDVDRRCVEVFLHLRSTGSNGAADYGTVIWDLRDHNGGGNYLLVLTTDRRLRVQFHATPYVTTPANTFQLNQTQHVAVIWTLTTIYIMLDGVEVASAARPAGDGSNTTISWLGRFPTGGEGLCQLDGFMDEHCYSIGHQVYDPAGFTPPTENLVTP